jgi:vancomycin resistance protein VanJ
MEQILMQTIRSNLKPLVNLSLAIWTLYGVIVTLMLILRFTIGERPIVPVFGSPVGTFNSMLQITLLPALPGLIWCLLWRRPRLAVWQLPALALLLVFYGGNFAPRVFAVAENAPRLHLLTYNLLFWNTHYDAIINIIQQTDADVVALQELSAPAADILTQEFQEKYPYQVVYPGDSSGSGILSRYPILEEEVWVDIHNQQKLVLQVADQTLTLFNVHTPIPLGYGADPEWRTATLQRILARAEGVTGDVMLVGDFNMGDGSSDYAKIAQSYTDSFKVAGYGFGLSFPDWSSRGGMKQFLPLLARLDYVFYRGNIQAVEAWTSHTSGGSDHRPYYVELAMMGN